MSNSNINKLTIEIRSGEGGSDAKIFVAQLAQVYIKLCQKRN